MSLNIAGDYDSGWAKCPPDILLIIFKKLDIISIINCMDVNTFWRDIVEYYCEKGNLWKEVYQHSIDDFKFTEKNMLGWRDQFVIARKWLSISYATVSLQHHYKLNDDIRHICVFKDNLIVVTNTGVKYFNINNFKGLKLVKQSCIKYEETSSLIAELISTNTYVQAEDPRKIIMYCGCDVLVLTNKLVPENFVSRTVKENIHLIITLFKVHMNACYVIDRRNVLWMYTAYASYWDIKALAICYGNRDSICSIHIYKKNVYVLLKRGDVLLVDVECKKFNKVYHLSVHLICLDSEPLMFQPFVLLINAPMTECGEKIEIYTLKKKDFVLSMSHQGATCVLEHGHSFLIGYANGKIEIYLTRKVIDSAKSPELEFNLETYLGKTNQPERNLRVISLDIFEDHIGHHLFVATPSGVYELLLG